MNCYEVLLNAYKTVIVNAEDENEAMEIARDETSLLLGWEMDDISIESFLDDESSIQDAIESGAEDLRD